MTKDIYLAALEEALRGVDAETSREILLDVSQHFAEGLARGRTEADICDGLGSPQKMAAECKAGLELTAFQRRSSLQGFVRLLRAILGVAGFNVLLAGPAVVLATFCAVFHMVAASIYLTGVLVISSTVTGVDRLPVTNDAGQVTVELAISMAGVSIENPDVHADAAETSAPASPDSTPNSWFNALVGVAYVLISVLLWNSSIRFDRRAIVWLAGYVRTNHQMVSRVRAVVSQEGP